MSSTFMFHQRIVAGLSALSLWLSVHTATAIVIVHLDVTPSGGNYHYEVSVQNGEPVDLAVVSLSNAPLEDGLIIASLTAPVEFLALYDSGLGFIDFLEHTTTFPPLFTISGFQFDSASAPPGFFTSASVIDINGNFYDGQVEINFTSVPDGGGTLASLALGLGAIVLGRKRLCSNGG